MDIILFGSSVKGKQMPHDIDIAVVTNNPEKVKEGKKWGEFHVSILTPKDFFIDPPTLINTLLREGWSIRYEGSFSENYGFAPGVLFKYSLKVKQASEKVKIVNILRGKRNDKGMVRKKGGMWIAHQVFTAPIKNENIFEKFFLNQEVKFKKKCMLIH